MKPPQPKPMIVAGVMSGTSADGIDVALCRIAPALRADTAPRLKLLGHRAFAYDKKLRAAILNIAAGNSTTAAELTQLSWRLGELYADCIATTAHDLNLKPQLAAIHGQTIYHQAVAAKFLGAPIRCTSQIGEPALIAERLRIPVVSDFRPNDLAAGGQGAPLVPMLDFCLFRHATKNRLLLNLGGIANVTALPAACTTVGRPGLRYRPRQHAHRPAACSSSTTAASTRTEPSPPAAACSSPSSTTSSPLRTSLRLRPKSCGREEFGGAFAHQLLALCTSQRARKQDVIATATALTSATILDAYRRICWPHLGQQRARSPAPPNSSQPAAEQRTSPSCVMLTEGFAPLGVKVSTTATSGMPVEAKEAAAFALLGWLTWHHLPGNIPSATGAARPVILGKVTYA